jgi:hypothetical protein
MSRTRTLVAAVFLAVAAVAAPASALAADGPGAQAMHWLWTG